MSVRVKPRVVKLGGSLLESPGMAGRLTHWLAGLPHAPTLLVVGGGELADSIRRVDELQGLGEKAAHWLCIDCMEITARVVDCLLPRATLVDNWGEVLEAVGEVARDDEELAGEEEIAGELIIFQCRTWLKEEEPEQAGTPLPHGWQVTSDSIAARLAEVLGAEELVLLKPADPPAGDAAALAAAGYVDEHFPTAAAKVPWRVVNLGAG